MKVAQIDPSQILGGPLQPPGALSKVPNEPNNPEAGISFFINKGIELIFMVAGVIFVFMVLFSALQWISSGGDKEKISAAQKRITHAVIGAAILSLAFVIIKVLGTILSFNFLGS